MTDPNSFVGYFTSGPLPVEIRFVGLMALERIVRYLRDSFARLKVFAKLSTRVNEIDVIVTSAGGHWRKGCSRLFEEYHERGDERPLLHG